MKFKNVKESVFQTEDINELVESLRVEANNELVLCFDLDLHIQRLLKSVLELKFKLPKGIIKQEFELFFLNQVKNKLQYQFNKQAAFTQSEFDDERNLLRLSNDIHKLRILYKKDGEFSLEIEKYTRSLNKEWRVKILTKEEFHIESTNPIWQHKFLPRPDFSFFLNQGYDEVIWRDENEAICEGSFTVIVFNDNKTPNANTLPSISLKEFPKTYKSETFILPKKFFLLNSLIGKVLASLD